jgi:threonine dehydrogenase-like Zn-dependent dehydrogenase
MATDYKFEGWLGHSPESIKGKMEWGPFEPKKWTEDDVDIQVTHCGICGSDLHMLRSGWGPTPYRTPHTLAPPLLRLFLEHHANLIT